MRDRPTLAPLPAIEPHLTADDVAALLKVSRKRVYALPIRKQPVGRAVRYRLSDVHLYLAQQRGAA